MSGFNPLTGSVVATLALTSVVDALEEQATEWFEIREDPVLDDDGNPVMREGRGDSLVPKFKQAISEFKDGNGHSATVLNLSVPSPTAKGTRKGSAKITASSDQIEDIVSAIDEFDPNAAVVSNSPDLPIAEVIRQTICKETVSVDGDDVEVVSFKTSLGSHARTVKIPLSEWDDVKEKIFSNLPAARDAWIKHMRNVIAEQEKEANAAAKKAKKSKS